MGGGNGLGRKSSIWRILTWGSMVLDTILHHEITQVSPYGHQPFQSLMQSNHATHPSCRIASAGHQSRSAPWWLYTVQNNIKEWVYWTSGQFKVSSNFGLLYNTVSLKQSLVTSSQHRWSSILSKLDFLGNSFTKTIRYLAS
jgi:hypothetical protein